MDSTGSSFDRVRGGLLLVAYSLFYVLPLYASAATRPSTTLSRDDSNVIRARVSSTAFSTTVCVCITAAILYGVDGQSVGALMHSMGYWPVGILESFRAILLTAALFAGPLYECLILHGFWTILLSSQSLLDVWVHPISWRNIVAGPVTEEFLFRSACIPLLIQWGISLRHMIFLSPLAFGLAHAHHFYEYRLIKPGVPLVVALIRTIFQLAYTTVFGAYATFIFLRSGSLMAVILIHAFCNTLGLPRCWGHVQPYWRPEEGEEGYRQPWLWTLSYYALLAAGSALWWSNLYVLTESDNALVRI